MSVINTNISAIAAQNSLRTTGLSQASAMERLSSGIRINSAKDDAAGLAISTRMTANIRGISAAIRNANDGISLTQTAEGSLISIGDNLQRIRELAVQSANSGNNASDRSALNNEASQLISEIDRIANNTTFNGIKLLDGSYKDQALQVGSGNEANDRIAVSIGDARSARLGAATTAEIKGEEITKGTRILEGKVTLNGYNVGATTSDGVSVALSEGSAISKANAINAISNKTGVIASARETTVTFNATGTADLDKKGFKFLLNGILVKGSVETVGKDVGSANNIVAAVNAQTSKTGVFAEIGTNGNYTLTASDGRNIVLSTSEPAMLKADGFDPSAPAPTGYEQGSWGTSGIDTTPGVDNAGEPTTNPLTGSDTWLDLETGEFAGASVTDGTGQARVIFGSIQLSTDSLNGITIGGEQADSNTLGIQADAYPASTSAGSGVGSVNLNTSTGAQSSLSTLDRAINAVTDMRAAMGAYQNRLTASIANLENTSMNLSASRSRILDTDYAKETTNLAKAQIIQQAATAMLAQANQSAQSVLALLK
jgi:flagellin